MSRIALLSMLVLLSCAGSAMAQTADAAAPFCDHGTAFQGQCMCQPGYEKDGFGACSIAMFVTNCVHGVEVSGSCQCNAGFDKDGTRACTVVTTAAPQTQTRTQPSNCAHGLQIVGKCMCQQGYSRDAGGRCTVERKN